MAIPSTFDPSMLGSHLQRGDDGVWFASERAPISYLEAGNEACFELEERSFWFRHRGACLAAAVRRFAPAGAIYDIGGGNGFVARVLMDAGFETVLVEPGEAGARNAARRGIPNVVCATLATARFAPGSFPAAGMFDVLEHIEDDADFLAQTHRCLAPRGRLFITVPAGQWLWSHDDVAAGHFRRYSIAGLEERVRAAGFDPLFSTHLFSLLPLPLFAMRSVPSLFGRRALPRQGYGRLHEPRAQGFTDRVWAAELRRIEAGRRIPFGSSILLVAEKRP